MKRLSFSTMILVVFALPAFGQLTKEHNYFRSQDELIKQQVGYKDPGKAGKNLLWDFSGLKTINAEYTLTYSEPPLEGDSVYIMGDLRFPKKDMAYDELIIGTEHNTMYYYRLKGDTLIQLGHENPSVRLMYTEPLTLAIFPQNYGIISGNAYRSKGIYSRTEDLETYGNITAVADAYGKLILPTGDTLAPVLRTKTSQIIFDAKNNKSETTQSNNITEDHGRLLETYKWYSKGYRYPVFETVKCINLNDSTELFSTAFFYPPQDHLYLETDPENLALLDKLWWQVENENNTQIKNSIQEDDQTSLLKAYPNPVTADLNVEYLIEKRCKVYIQVYSIEGKLIKNIDKKVQEEGTYKEIINCSDLTPGGYLLKVTAGKSILNQKIVKL